LGNFFLQIVSSDVIIYASLQHQSFEDLFRVGFFVSRLYERQKKKTYNFPEPHLQHCSHNQGHPAGAVIIETFVPSKNFSPVISRELLLDMRGVICFEILLQVSLCPIKNPVGEIVQAQDFELL
jgi:hypothetical protein